MRKDNYWLEEVKTEVCRKAANSKIIPVSGYYWERKLCGSFFFIIFETRRKWK